MVNNVVISYDTKLATTLGNNRAHESFIILKLEIEPQKTSYLCSVSII